MYKYIYMSNTTDLISESIAWSGNAIFAIAQIIQIIHTFKVKKTHDISYGLQILWVIGNCLYTGFGYFIGSLSMFIGNLITSGTMLFQIGQKIYYDNYYKQPGLLLLNEVI